MKKLLLSFVAIAMASIGVAQVSFLVLDPSSNSGGYAIAETGTGWGVPDLNDPNNSVSGTMVLVDDGDSDPLIAREGCTPLSNGAAVSGNIAVIWRGNCEFGTKALNAQNAGAIAVVIVNNDGEPTSMGAGADGGSVNIPVIMISTNTGNLLLSEITAGTADCFIGNKFGFFDNDLRMAQKDILRARQFATPSALAQDDTEFSVNSGSWIYNVGINDQTDVVLTCEVTGPGVTGTHLESSTPINLVAGDSIFIPLPPFSQGNYPEEYYTVEYSVTSHAGDDDESDNSLNADFMITDKEYAISRLDATTKEAIAAQHFQPGTFTAPFYSCIHFSDPNASRRVAHSITFNATSSATSIDGEYVTVEGLTWDDASTDINDPNFSMDDINDIAFGEYEYAADDQDVPITVMFEEPFLMEDDVHYLFCVTTGSQDVFFGYDNALDYDRNITNDGHVVSVNRSGNNWFGLGFGTDLAAALILNTEDATWLGVDDEQPELELEAAYPNPAVNEITVPLNGISGQGQLNIVDLTGKTVLSQAVNLNDSQLKVDITNISGGMYVFNLNLENGQNTSFNVVVSK